MFEKIEIRNFKSIIKEKVSLNKLNVIIGANGSGKSNLIKALEFLSEIPDGGVQGAVNMFGGFQGIVPKAIPKKKIRDTTVRLSYTLRLPDPINYPPQYGPLTVNHEIEFSTGIGPGSIHVREEKLTFKNPLQLSSFLHRERVTLLQ